MVIIHNRVSLCLIKLSDPLAADFPGIYQHTQMCVVLSFIKTMIYIYLCITSVGVLSSSAYQKRAEDSMGLQVQMVVSLPAGAGK